MKVKTNDIFLAKEKIKELSLSCQLDENNLFNTYKNANKYWQDSTSLKIREHADLYKKESGKMLNKLNSLLKIYDYLYREYLEIGKNIDIDLERIDKSIEKIIYMLDNLNNIYDKFIKIDITTLNEVEKEYYYEINSMLKKSINIFTKIKDNIKEKVIKVKEIEATVKAKTNKINENG